MLIKINQKKQESETKKKNRLEWEKELQLARKRGDIKTEEKLLRIGY